MMLTPLLLVLAAAPNGGPEVRTVTGSLDKDLIRGVIKEGRPAVDECHAKARVARPEVAGTVKVKFVIAKTGAVSSAEVANDAIGDAELAACLTKTVQGWTFPAPKGGGIVVVNYPFVFAKK